MTPVTYKGRPAIFGHFMDITDRKAMEEKIRESETLYRTIFETTGTATIIIEEDTTVALVNSEFERLYGAPKQYWEGKRSWLEFAAEKERGPHAPVSQPEAHGPQGGAGALRIQLS